MLSVYKRNVKIMNGTVERDGVLYDVRCLSTDDKPVGDITNGSTCIEIDTGKKYLFNGTSGAWVEISGATVIICASGVYY